MLAQIGESIEEDVLICGHTHIPYFNKINDKYFINVGSVGKPKHGDSQATYVVVEIENNQIHCTIEKVVYNVEQLIRDIEQNPMISNQLIEMIQQGK